MITRKQLVEKISPLYPSISEKDINSIVSDIFKTIKKETIENNNEVQIQGFGKFENKLTNVKKGRDPRTGENVILRAKKNLKFTGASIK